MEQAHFGGGMFKKKGDVNERETETAPKSRKDVMLDIIAKSKTAKVRCLLGSKYHKHSIKPYCAILVECTNSQKIEFVSFWGADAVCFN